MRPKLARAINEFAKINVGVSEVGKIIGGKVDYNINQLTLQQGRFENACAIRMSYALNNSGLEIPHIPSHTVSGKMVTGIFIPVLPGNAGFQQVEKRAKC